jgi:hypothetical protein
MFSPSNGLSLDCIWLTSEVSPRLSSTRCSFVDGTSELSAKHRKDTALDLKKNQTNTTFFLSIWTSDESQVQSGDNPFEGENIHLLPDSVDKSPGPSTFTSEATKCRVVISHLFPLISIWRNKLLTVTF